MAQRYRLKNMDSWMPKRGKYDKKRAAGSVYLLLSDGDLAPSSDDTLHILGKAASNNLEATDGGCGDGTVHFPDGAYEAYHYLILGGNNFNPGILFMADRYDVDPGTKLEKVEEYDGDVCSDGGNDYKRYLGQYVSRPRK